MQAMVLVAGVAMNLIFAYVLITGALIAGTPRALSPSEIANARNVELAVANVLPEHARRARRTSRGRFDFECERCGRAVALH